MTPQHDQFDQWRNDTNARLNEVRNALQDVLVEVKQRPTRQEIEIMISSKVGHDVFASELKAVRDDITEMRGKPEAARSWVNVAATAGGCLVSALAFLLSIAIAVGSIVAQHWKP